MNKLLPLDGKTIVLHADAGPSRGLGHVMRSIALGEALLTAGARCMLASQPLPQSIAGYAKRCGLELMDPGADLACDCLIVDSYDIDAAGRAELFRHAQRRVVIDDMRNNGPYAADLLINPNPGATEYAEMRSAVGADYVLLRREILGAKAPRDYTGARNILISCGGSDPSGAAQVTLDALQNFTNAVLHIRCIAGPFTAPSTKLDMALHSCEVIEQTTEMQQHLNWADIAILAAGSTLWEAAYLATPMLAIVVADNQMPGTRAAADVGALMMIDWRQRAAPAGLLAMFTEMHANQARRASFAEHAAALIDGLGAERAAQQIAQIV